MAKDFSQLRGDMKVLGTKVTQGTDRIVQKAATVTLQQVVTSTPVDTGLARSNWLVSIGRRINSVIPPYFPYPKRSGPKIEETSNALAAIVTGMEKIEQFKSPRNSTIHIVNNIRYMADLDVLGTSQQQSPGFVRRAVDAGMNAIRSMKILG